MTEQQAGYHIGDPGDETRPQVFRYSGASPEDIRDALIVELDTGTGTATVVCKRDGSTTPRLGYTADEVEEVALGEYQLKPGVAPVAVGMAPTYEELAAAVQAFDHGLFPLNMPLPPSLELAWNDVWGQMTMLAARLPKGR